MKTLFYRCPICGSIIVKLVDTGVIPWCCGHPMQELKAQTEQTPDAYKPERHIPCAQVTDDRTVRIRVGEEPHPMSPEHQISLICLECDHSLAIRFLSPGDRPSASFCRVCDSPKAVYAYCNLHGLWRNSIEV